MRVFVTDATGLIGSPSILAAPFAGIDIPHRAGWRRNALARCLRSRGSSHILRKAVRSIVETPGVSRYLAHSIFERMRRTGHADDFYMFEQIKSEVDQLWSDAAVTIPGALYWASGSAPSEGRWNPLDPVRSLYRPAPGPLPSWVEPDYGKYNIAEFQRTGFHGALNYYRAAEPYFYLSSAWKGAKITQPSFHVSGKADGLGALYPPAEKLLAGLPGLLGHLELTMYPSTANSR